MALDATDTLKLPSAATVMFCASVTPLAVMLTVSPGTAASTLPLSVVLAVSVATPLTEFEVISTAAGLIVGATRSNVKLVLALSDAMLPAASLCVTVAVTVSALLLKWLASTTRLKPRALPTFRSMTVVLTFVPSPRVSVTVSPTATAPPTVPLTVMGPAPLTVVMSPIGFRAICAVVVSEPTLTAALLAL